MIRPLAVFAILLIAVSGSAAQDEREFPPPLESYGDSGMTSVAGILAHRIDSEPFNLWATLLFICAIVHTFLTHKFRHIAHQIEERRKHRTQLDMTGRNVSASSRVFHFLGELEAVFGIWIVPLILLMNISEGAGTSRAYLIGKVDFTEAVFVIVIMSIASTRPILALAEQALGAFARLGGGTPAAWWLSILIVGPLLGSFITEPAAMTICALLLSQKFYSLNPGKHFGYATLGILFVNISIGGTLTHFAAPPVLMVAGPWGWDSVFMITHFGWKAALSAGISAVLYYMLFRRQLAALAQRAAGLPPAEKAARIPAWITAGHLAFMAFTVISSHDMPYLVFGMLFFLAFVEVTADFQQNFNLRPAILVGFFLAGLVTHGGLQQWWIEPVLGSLGELPLMLGAMTLTAFNDNAAITYLCTFVPTFTEGMKYAAVAGAVAGGGLTVIANAPNPAGASILGKHFEDGIGAVGLAAGAALPTLIAMLCYILL